ncbi:MAG: alpha/beta fold hydrolase [Lewinellaceae bacterium]|nr:alpha/beta fold hydrolase [Lewinellaceae bacterium]
MKQLLKMLTTLKLANYGYSIVFLMLFQNCALAQSIEPTQVKTLWKRISCPFDSSKAQLPVICGRLKVPENYNAPEGRSIEIAFMVIKAHKNSDPENPVLFLSGGPGMPSLYFAETLVTSPLIHDVVVDRDWVFFDQRGTGRSIPQLYCPDDQDNPFDLEKCRDNLIEQGIDLSQYNSANSANDMEELRKALCMNQWNLWGISYGSRLAFTMARYYPSSVRAIIHDGPALPEGQELIDDAIGLDVALNKLFTKCAVDSACSSKFPQLRSRFTETLVRLREQPLLVGEQSYNDSKLIYFIRNWLYPRGYSTYEQRIQNLLILMDAAARGDGQLMFETQQKMRKEEGLDKVRPLEPIYAQQSLGQNLSVYCNESKPFESKCEYDKAIANSEIVRSFLPEFGGSSVCDLWPSGQAEQIANSHVYYDGPQLVFTGELDASSSCIVGYKIEMLYANAINVVFKNGIHGQFPVELPNSEDLEYWKCALQLGHQFFADPTQKLNTDCAKTRQLHLVR